MFRDPPQEKEKNKANNNKAVKFGVKFWERASHVEQIHAVYKNVPCRQEY